MDSGCLPDLQQTGCSGELDVVYERKKGVKNKIKVFGLSKLRES